MAVSSLFCLQLLLLILLASSLGADGAQPQRNISLGSSLTPLGPNTSWLSPSGEFAFGFRPLGPNTTGLFLLAVWLDKIPMKTAVWYINGDQQAPLQAGSKLELTTDGQLSLTDHTGQEVWNPGATSAAYAAVLDTGNFLLAGSDASPIWQSFGSPSDTILPSQVLSLGTQLQARLMDTDYSPGRFTLAVQTDGNLVFYPAAVPSGYQYDAYWASNTVGNGTQLVFDKTGSIYLALNNDTQFNVTSAGTEYSPEDFYHRATLDPDGVFRQFVYPKNATSSGSWTVVDFQPPDICRAIRSDSGGSGACGFNSYCVSGGSQSVDCECPPRYSFLDPNRKYRGCVPDFAAQSCEGDGSPAAEVPFQLKEMINVDWPLADYEHYYPVDESRCRNECLSDCFCAVAIYNGGDCWKKKLPLSNGLMGNQVDRKALIKVPTGNNSQPQSPPIVVRQKENQRRTLILVGSLLLGGSVFANFILLCVILIATSGSHNTRAQKRSLSQSSTSKAVGLRSFTYAELEKATNQFSEELGRGASSVVYKGCLLQTEPRTCVAVKKLDKLSSDAEKEFTSEVRAIGQTYHKNLVRLLGFCNEGTERLLVYEFMSNGSLKEFLFGGARPEWNTRVRIALGIARGLLYLHEECSNQIIHCDIKPQNILLDDSFVARIADFGLAKLLRTDQTQTSTGIRGTRGYVAPEWFKGGQITAKVDVYSFGVMLLEIVCCRRNVESEAGNEEQAILTYWATDCYTEGRLDRLLEGDGEALLDMSTVERFVTVALWCIQEEPGLRPTMQKVTQMLDGAAPIPAPPEPNSNISSSIKYVSFS